MALTSMEQKDLSFRKVNILIYPRTIGGKVRTELMNFCIFVIVKNRMHLRQFKTQNAIFQVR